MGAPVPSRTYFWDSPGATLGGKKVYTSTVTMMAHMPVSITVVRSTQGATTGKPVATAVQSTNPIAPMICVEPWRASTARG